MKGFSSALSISAHIAIGAAALFGTTKSARSDPTSPRMDSIIFTVPHSETGAGMGLSGPITIGPPPVVGSISTSVSMPQTGTLIPPFSTAWSARGNAGAGPLQLDGEPGPEERAEVLTSPLPLYPDLLRQAGVEGRVVLDAVVDTTGRVVATSIQVVTATNAGFVAPARQALLATLFRPAMVGGRPIRMLVRIPYEFTIRNGTGRAR
jgi:TonB family protein